MTARINHSEGGGGEGAQNVSTAQSWKWQGPATAGLTVSELNPSAYTEGQPHHDWRSPGDVCGIRQQQRQRQRQKRQRQRQKRQQRQRQKRRRRLPSSAQAIPNKQSKQTTRRAPPRMHAKPKPSNNPRNHDATKYLGSNARPSARPSPSTADACGPASSSPATITDGLG